MMKTAAIIIFLGLMLGGVPVLSQTASQNGGNAATEPPHRIQVNFNARYPEAAGSARWQQTEEGYQATFNSNNQKVVSTFDQEGQWIRSRTEMKESDLPENAKKYLKENFSQYEYRNGYRYENEKGTRHEINLRSQNKDYLLNFDKNGGFTGEKVSN